MFKSIIQLILDFALEPALLDAVGAGILFFVYFRFFARRTVVRSAALAILGYGLCFLSLTAGFSVTAASGRHWVVYLGFAGVFVVGAVMTVRGRFGWAVVLTAVVWATDTWVTARLLFE